MHSRRQRALRVWSLLTPDQGGQVRLSRGLTVAAREPITRAALLVPFGQAEQRRHHVGPDIRYRRARVAGVVIVAVTQVALAQCHGEIDLTAQHGRPRFWCSDDAPVRIAVYGIPAVGSCVNVVSACIAASIGVQPR
jgi:hypothetical protein